MSHAHEAWEFQAGWSAYSHTAGYTMTLATPSTGTLEWAVYEGTDTDGDSFASGSAHSIPAAFLSASLAVERHSTPKNEPDEP